MSPDALKTKLTTTRLDETRDWYRAVCGMRIVEEWDEPGDCGCILAFAEGPEQALLEIYRGERASDFSGLSLQFRVADIVAFEAVLPRDVPRRGPVKRPWGSRYLYLDDPNGVAVIVYQGGY